MFLEPHQVCLEDYPIHTVTGLVKQWLRELPDPLMTFTHYNDFLHAVGEEDSSHQGAVFPITRYMFFRGFCVFSYYQLLFNQLCQCVL